MTLDELRRVAAGCTNCELHAVGTQTVFGEGDPGADVMLVGEQPGDKEDLAGRPFVGPAGRLLDQAMEEAGLDRDRAYVTNAVKHFRWEAKGKVRLHKKPGAEHIRACHPWLEQELELVRPRIVIALGATAAQALFGKGFKVTERRGQLVEWDREPMAMATVHPSSILRGDPESRRAALAGLVSDLRVAADALR